ncbi:hypothetical protein [Winogradskyella sp.]|uniref:hypothetical protein n=1 Tax=Winogradskyella sp. TaxID=1883156 RepID=UPI0026029961|nr:hypothetical protein [Winogradskyella sp.]
MLKNFFSLVFMALMIVCYGQKSTLLQNINYRAKELKHSLNEKGDTLILESAKTIYSVDIFNQDYEKTVEVKGNETAIPLHDTPMGRLVVQAKMSGKRILMTLLRHEKIEYTPANTSSDETLILSRPKLQYLNSSLKPKIKFKVTDKASILKLKTIVIPFFNIQKQELETENILVTTPSEDDEVHQQRPKTSLSSMLNWKPKKKIKSNRLFWICYVVNNGTNTRKIMKMMRHNEVDQLINRLKIENKTSQGKSNTLTVWEIYNSSKFMEQQVANPDYIHSTTSDLFNVVPYYNSSKDLVASN